MSLTAALLVMAAAPSAEALDLGRVVAANGTLATIAPIMARKDVEDLIKDNPSLTPDEQARLRATADKVMADSIRRLVDGEAHAFAAELSVEDLRVLAAHVQTPANRNLRAKMPAIMMKTVGTIGQLDFKKDLTTAFCANTGKLCDKR